MNIEDIKKKVEDYKAELIKSRECCDVVDLSDEVLYLLSVIGQAEKDLLNIEQWFISMCMEGRAESVRDILKAIRGN